MSLTEAGIDAFVASPRIRERTARDLTRLQQADLVRGDSLQDVEFRFKHSLIQEATYATLIRDQRRALHREVAEAILRLQPEIGDHQPAILARHYFQAGEAEPAFRFAIEAGLQARANHAYPEAIATFDLALQLIDRLPVDRYGPQIREAFLGKGTALEVSGRHEEARQAHRAMEAYARQNGNLPLEAEALIRLATMAVVTFDPAADVGALLERAESLARQSGDRLILARTLWNQGLRDRFVNPLRADEFFLQALEMTRSPEVQALPPEAGARETEAHILVDLMVAGITSGRRKMAVQNGTEALAEFRLLGNQAMAADALAGLANLYHAGAAFETAIRCCEEGRSISEAIENPWGITYNGWARVQIDADRADWERALEHGSSLLAYAERVPFVGFRLALNSVLTHVWIDLGQPARGAEIARRTAQLWRESSTSTVGWESWVQAIMALSHLSLGDVASAASLLEPLRRLPEGVIAGFQNYYYVGPVIARLDLERRDFDRGLVFATELIERFETEEADRFAAEMRFWRARLHADQGAWEDAHHDLLRALDLLQSAGVRSLQWQIHAALAEVLHAIGDRSSAAENRRAARAIVEAISSGLRDPDLRTSFLSRPDVSSLMG